MKTITIISKVTQFGDQWNSIPIKACTDYHDAIRIINSLIQEPGVTYDTEEIPLYLETDVDEYLEETAHFIRRKN